LAEKCKASKNELRNQPAEQQAQSGASEELLRQAEELQQTNEELEEKAGY